VPRARRLAAGILLASGLVAAPAAAAVSALAAPARPAPAAPPSTGEFLTWPDAQHAAGFALRRPTDTYGLTRPAGIMVQRCPAERGKRVVIATYGTFKHRLLGIQQNNFGGQCVSVTGIRRLHTYSVEGTNAHLWGACHVPGTPTCKTRLMWMFLSWRKDGVFYLATSHNVRRATIVGFARNMVKAGG
jgi:hypothetical protein